ncbi:hypothetical protein [Paenibacillus campinasensis]|uniref:hypothetical protein n=1 Tax=Paenibacillus campinasensis TaxID=66347 RepID=UPI0015C97FDD|nr:hypothetical protein [Paenibacillus campinasensis]
MFVAQPIDFDEISECLAQKQYEESMLKLKAAYEKARANGDQEKMTALLEAMDEL